MRSSALLFLLAGCGLLFAGCGASGVKYSAMSSTIPPVAPGEGRVFFYRTSSIIGVAVTCPVTLNGRVVGKSESGGFFYADVPPGPCLVTATTEKTNTLNFDLAEGETQYVRTSTSMGWTQGRVTPELVPAAQALSEISGCAYTGKPIPKAAAPYQ